MFNSTMHCQVGDVAQAPFFYPSEKDAEVINEIAAKQVSLSKADWDSQETSWDFKRNSLV